MPEPFLKVKVYNAERLAEAITDPMLLNRILEPAFREGAVVVEARARMNVHVVTRKLMGSLGHYITGIGRNIEAHIGPQPGLAQDAYYTPAMTSSWEKPRYGVNSGDPAEYGIYEEAAHPFLEPALEDSENDIDDAVARSAERELGRMARKLGLFRAA